MENQKEFDDLAKKVDSLLRVQKNLVKEFKDNCHNPSPHLITSIQNLSAELKDVQDRLSKVKVDEGLPEPSIGFTPKFSVDWEVIPINPKPVSDFNPHLSISTDSNLAGEGNYRSTKTQFSFCDEAHSKVEVQKRNGNSTFLDYQEGKTFSPNTNLVVDSRSKGAGTPEENDFNAFNLNYNDKPQQFEESKFSDEDNLNRSTSVCDVLACVMYTWLIFDRGRYFDGSIIMNQYSNGFVYKMILKLGYGVELLFVKMSKIKAVKLSDVGVNFLLHLKMGRVFDRGKDIELQKRYSKFYVHLKLLDGYHKGLVEELPYEHGYWSDSLFTAPVAGMLDNGRVCSTGWQLFIKILPVDIRCFDHKCFFNHTLPTGISSYHCFKFADRVLDRGREFELIQGLSPFVGDSEGYCDTITSCLFVLLERHNGEWVFKLFPRHGYQYEFQLFHRFHDTMRIARFQLQLQYKLLAVVTPHLRSLGIFQIHLKSCAHVIEFILMDTSSIHTGFFTMPFGVKFHYMLLFYKEILAKVVGIKKVIVNVNGSEYCCMGSWQDDDGFELNEKDNVLETKLMMVISVRRKYELFSTELKDAKNVSWEAKWHVRCWKKEFKFLLVLARTQSYLSRNGFFLNFHLFTSETCKSFSIPGKVLTANWYSKLMGVYECHIYHLCSSYMLGLICKAMEYYNRMLGLIRKAMEYYSRTRPLVRVVGILEMLIVFTEGESKTQELLEEVFKAVCSCTQLEVEALKLTPICNHMKDLRAINEDDYIASLKLKEVILTDKESICMGSVKWDANDDVKEPGHKLQIRLEVILSSSDSRRVGYKSLITSGCRIDKREFSNSMTAGSVMFIRSQLWQVVFLTLQICSTNTTKSPLNSVKYHIARVVMLQPDEVKVILVTALHDLSTDRNTGFSISRGCWQQLLVTVKRKSLVRFVVLAAKYFLDNFYQLSKQPRLSTTDGTTVHGKEESAKSIQLTNASYEFWYKAYRLSMLLFCFLMDGFKPDARHYVSRGLQELNAFASFNSSFGCHGKIMIHQFEGKLIMLVPYGESKQRYSISISVKEDIEQYEGIRDLLINLSSIKVALAFLYWLVVQSCLYDLVLFIALKCAYTDSSIAAETYQAVKRKRVGLLAEIP